MNENTPAVRKITNVKELLRSDAARRQLQQVAANVLSPERMMRLVANATRQTPELNNCEPMGLLGAMMTAASLGLECNTPRGHAYLIPFKNRRKGITEAQLVIGYKGYLDMAMRSGVLTEIDMGIHYSDDDLWQYEKGMNATLRHAEGPQQGDPLHAYAIAKWKNPGGSEGMAMVVLPWAKVMQVRDNSQGWKMALRNGKTENSPWSTHTDAMAMKTAIRALAQQGRLPMSVDLQTALDVDSSRVDFSSFAASTDRDDLQPTSDADGPTIEGDAKPVDDPARDEQEDEGSDPIEDEPRERRFKNPSNSKPGNEQKAADEKAAEDGQAFRDRDDLINDLIDAGPDNISKVLNDVRWKPVIHNLQQNEPKLWDDVQEVIKGLTGEDG